MNKFRNKEGIVQAGTRLTVAKTIAAHEMICTLLRLLMLLLSIAWFDWIGIWAAAEIIAYERR